MRAAPQRIALFLALLMANLRPLAGQAITTAVVQGTVDGQDSLPVPNAVVEVTNTATGQFWRVETSDAGRYFFGMVTIGGPYRVAVRAIGFGPAARTGVMLSIGQRYTADFFLEPASRDPARSGGAGRGQPAGQSRPHRAGPAGPRFGPPPAAQFVPGSGRPRVDEPSGKPCPQWRTRDRGTESTLHQLPDRWGPEHRSLHWGHGCGGWAAALDLPRGGRTATGTRRAGRRSQRRLCRRCRQHRDPFGNQCLAWQRVWILSERRVGRNRCRGHPSGEFHELPIRRHALRTDRAEPPAVLPERGPAARGHSRRWGPSSRTPLVAPT